ncbi:MAG TPA: S8 family serine peptidase [Solirubrobacterales bacterium]|nr:S8 family serine peptidase [Solirubrobacterales bacterium]
MDRRPFAIAVAALALLLTSVSSASAARVLVKFRGGVGGPEAARALAAQGTRQLRRIEGIGVRVVAVPAGHERGALAALARDPRVLFAEPDAIAKPQETIPNDPYFPRGSYSISSGAWGWYQTHTTQAWDLTTGSASTTIAIVDTGLKPQSLDFGGQLVGGYNVLNGSTDTSSTAGNHGTYVAGVAGLAMNTASGSAGYCPGCRIMPVQVGTDSGATNANIAAGIVWAADHGARVINLSWAGPTASSTLSEAVAYARAKGAVVFAAAGNSNCDCPTYPAATPGVIGVAGVAMSGAKAGDSNYGSWVDLAAPEGNMTAWPSLNGAPGYGPVGGTSVASPAAAGVAGLLLSVDPGLGPAEVEQVLEGSATPTSFTVAHGEVDAMAALRALGLADSQSAGAPLNQVAPQVLVETNGDQAVAPLAAPPQPGQVLVRGQGAWSGSSPLSLSGVKWYRCALGDSACTQVGSAWKYTVSSEDAGYAIKLAVTFTDPSGSAVAVAPLTEPVGGTVAPSAPVNSAPPVISGTAEEGQVLAATTGTWSNSPTAYAFQWRRCDAAGASCNTIAGATAQTYALGSADVGSTLRVAVTASNTGGAATAESAASAPVVAKPPPSQQTLSFSGSLTNKVLSRSYQVSVGSGLADARLSFSNCKSLTLTLQSAAGTTLASASGPSMLVLDQTLAAGTYTYVVSGSGRCSFGLTVTSPAP